MAPNDNGGLGVPPWQVPGKPPERRYPFSGPPDPRAVSLGRVSAPNGRGLLAPVGELYP